MHKAVNPAHCFRGQFVVIAILCISANGFARPLGTSQSTTYPSDSSSNSFWLISASFPSLVGEGIIWWEYHGVIDIGMEQFWGFPGNKLYGGIGLSWDLLKHYDHNPCADCEKYSSNVVANGMSAIVSLYAKATPFKLVSIGILGSAGYGLHRFSGTLAILDYGGPTINYGEWHSSIRASFGVDLGIRMSEKLTIGPFVECKNDYLLDNQGILSGENLMSVVKYGIVATILEGHK